MVSWREWRYTKGTGKAHESQLERIQMAKVKRNDTFDISLFAYTGKSRNILKMRRKNWGTMETLCIFPTISLYTLYTEGKLEVFIFGRAGDESSWAREEFWMSRGRVLDESGMSLMRWGRVGGWVGRTPWQSSSSSAIFDWWSGSEKADPWWKLVKGRMLRYNY